MGPSDDSVNSLIDLCAFLNGTSERCTRIGADKNTMPVDISLGEIIVH